QDSISDQIQKACEETRILNELNVYQRSNEVGNGLLEDKRSRSTDSWLC
ncbi:unnamed protein product, partial [Brassica rapa subsp. trilocularis]